jgi:chemotaxis protein MotA
VNIGTLIGFFIASAVFVLSVVMSFRNVSVIVDLHAALIVIGGTGAVALICFPMKQIGELTRVFFRRILGKNRRDYDGIIKELVTLSDARRKGQKSFDAVIPKVRDPFLRDAAGLLFWAKSEISEAELRDLLETRVKTHYHLYQSEAKIFRTMSKFPPAFGLMGTTMGMIALLQSLGSPDAKNMIGPSMAIALVATLYGLVLTNFVFIPIAENLMKQTQEDLIARNIVVEGVMLINADKPTRYVEEKAKSFLLPSQRKDNTKKAA